MPPISRHEFNLALNACTDQCVWSLIHDCYTIGNETEAVARIPKKKSLFGIESNDLTIKFAWGIQTRYSISFFHVVIYHVLMLLMPFGVWIWWQHKHNGDMQNASMPFTIVLTQPSLFWSGAGALEQFMANYYFLDPNPLRIGKDSRTSGSQLGKVTEKLGKVTKFNGVTTFLTTLNL